MAVDGALYGKIITFNNVDPNSSPAGALGFSVDADVSLPMFKYVGARIGFHSDRYAIAFAENGTPIEVDDFVYGFDLALKGQYELELEEWLVKPAVHLGVANDDLLIFRQQFTEDDKLTFMGLATCKFTARWRWCLRGKSFWCVLVCIL